MMQPPQGPRKGHPRDPAVSLNRHDMFAFLRTGHRSLTQEARLPPDIADAFTVPQCHTADVSVVSYSRYVSCVL